MKATDLATTLTTIRQLDRRRLENAVFTREDFAEVALTSTEFYRCAFKQNRFGGCSLREVVFERCRFEKNVFTEADVRGARFRHCRGLSPAQIAHLEQAGALIEQPSRSPWSLLLPVAVLGLGAFLLAGGWSWLRNYLGF